MAFFVDIDYLKKNSLIHGNVNTDQLSVILRRTQKLRIEPVLGTPLYKDLLDKIENGGLTSYDVTLLNDYLIPCLMIYCEIMAAKYYNVEIRNKSVGRSNDEYQVANTDTQNAVFTDELYTNAKVFEQTMIGYLIDNEENFPKYCEYQSDLKEDVPPKPESDSYDDTMSLIFK